MKHRCKVKGEQVITLQMTQQLKIKSINVIPGQLFYRQCKDKFSLETETLCINDEVINTIKSYISEAYKVQVHCLEDSESDSY